MNACTAGAVRRVLGSLAIACAVDIAVAETPPDRALEEAFWACDYIATTRGTAAAPGETCAAVYEQMKATRFGGDFEALLAWWQVGKRDAHASVAQSIAARPAETPPGAALAVPRERPSRVARLLAATRAYFSEFAAVLRDD